jgi:hypothetical protein
MIGWQESPIYELLLICVAVILITTAIAITLAVHVNSVLPLNGSMRIITVKDIVSDGTVGNPPCINVEDYDCIVSYEYSIESTDGDWYRLSGKFKSRYSDDPLAMMVIPKSGDRGEIKCQEMSSDSKDAQRDMRVTSSWDGITISNHDNFFGCNISRVP